MALRLNNAIPPREKDWINSCFNFLDSLLPDASESEDEEFKTPIKIEPLEEVKEAVLTPYATDTYLHPNEEEVRMFNDYMKDISDKK